MSRLPAVMPGDWNLPVAELQRLIVDKLDAGRLVHGHGVDHVLTTDGVEVIAVHRLPRAGSDHTPLLVRLRLRGGELLTLLWWNVYVGQSPADVFDGVMALIGEASRRGLGTPHVVALTEAYRCRSMLGQVGGYELLQGTGPGEARNVAVLVRDDVELLGHGWEKMRRRWIGPKHGLRKAPREFVKARLRLPGGTKFRLLAVHLPTGGIDGPNAPAVREAVRRVKRWANR